MDAFLILMVSVVTCVSYHYNDHDTYYRPRHGFNRLSSLPTLYGRTPFGRHRKRFQPRLYRENDYPDRSVYPSPSVKSVWLREVEKKKEAPVTENPKHPNSSLGVYGVIKNKQIGATLVKDDKYPWIARVVHTPDGSAPVLCTAACIEERIFVTAARCIYNAKLFYTSVHYQDEVLQPIALVLPSKPTKQMFHDHGLIVVNKKFSKTWKTLPIFHYWKWTDDEYMWHAKAPWYVGYAIGYVSDPSGLRHDMKNIAFPLYELLIIVSNYLCNYVYNTHTPDEKYFVPCYFSCTLEDYYQRSSSCDKHLAGEGHILVDKKTGDKGNQYKLFGVATWAGYHKNKTRNLPVGFAHVASPAFKEDFECAKKIKAAPDTSERFDKLCK